MKLLLFVIALCAYAADAPTALSPEDARTAAAAKLQMAQDAQRVAELNARAQKLMSEALKLQSEAQSLQSQAVAHSMKAQESQRVFVGILEKLRAKSNAAAQCGLDNSMNWVIPIVNQSGEEQFQPCPVAKPDGKKPTESGQ